MSSARASASAQQAAQRDRLAVRPYGDDGPGDGAHIRGVVEPTGMNGFEVVHERIAPLLQGRGLWRLSEAFQMSGRGGWSRRAGRVCLTDKRN